MAKYKNEDLLAVLSQGKPVMLAEYRGFRIVTGKRHVTEGENQGRGLDYARVEHVIESELDGEVCGATITQYLRDGDLGADFKAPALKGEKVLVVVNKYGKVGSKGAFTFTGDIAAFGSLDSRTQPAPV